VAYDDLGRSLFLDSAFRITPVLCLPDLVFSLSVDVSALIIPKVASFKMSLRQSFSEPEGNQSSDSSGSLSILSPVLPLFRRIPPERVGLCGEYDYNGLSKRVEHCFRQHCCPDDLLGLRVSQRGAIVLLRGRFSSPQIKHELVTLALGVDGAVGVEVNGETIFPPLRACGLGAPVSLHQVG
jgi:hypothetical protein